MSSFATFAIKPIRELVNRYVRPGARWVDPFARDAKVGSVTNDLNPATSADYHMEAIDFLDWLYRRGEWFDGGLYDPPYSERQVREMYSGYGMHVFARGYHRRCRDALDRIIKPGGMVITCGWDSGGMGLVRDYRLIDGLLVAHGGHRHDTLVVVERKLAAPSCLAYYFRPPFPRIPSYFQ
jgi:hypothetical protein